MNNSDTLSNILSFIPFDQITGLSKLNKLWKSTSLLPLSYYNNEVKINNKTKDVSIYRFAKKVVWKRIRKNEDTCLPNCEEIIVEVKRILSIPRAPKLKKLSVKSENDAYNIIPKYLSLIPSLESLTIDINFYSLEKLTSYFHNNQTLRELSISAQDGLNGLIYPNDFFPPNLTSLTINSDFWVYSMLSSISTLRLQYFNFPKIEASDLLTVLRSSMNTIETIIIKKIDININLNVLHLPKLKSLAFGTWSWLIPHSTSCMISFPSLEYLNIENKSYQYVMIPINISLSKELKEIDLRGCKINGEIGEKIKRITLFHSQIDFDILYNIIDKGNLEYINTSEMIKMSKEKMRKLVRLARKKDLV